MSWELLFKMYVFAGLVTALGMIGQGVTEVHDCFESPGYEPTDSKDRFHLYTVVYTAVIIGFIAFMLFWPIVVKYFMGRYSR